MEELEETGKTILINVKDIVNSIFDLARHVQPYLRLEQEKVRDLAAKARNLEDTIGGMCSHTVGHVYHCRTYGPGQQSMQLGDGRQNNTFGSGVFSLMQSET